MSLLFTSRASSRNCRMRLKSATSETSVMLGHLWSSASFQLGRNLDRYFGGDKGVKRRTFAESIGHRLATIVLPIVQSLYRVSRRRRRRLIFVVVSPKRGQNLSVSQILTCLISRPLDQSLTPHFSGASGNRSITYFPRATLMMGTPGTFRMRLLRSRSFVATM